MKIFNDQGMRVYRRLHAAGTGRASQRAGGSFTADRRTGARGPRWMVRGRTEPSTGDHTITGVTDTSELRERSTRPDRTA